MDPRGRCGDTAGCRDGILDELRTHLHHRPRPRGDESHVSSSQQGGVRPILFYWQSLGGLSHGQLSHRWGNLSGHKHGAHDLGCPQGHARARDLYDVWRLSQLKLDVSSIISDKFCFKDVTFNLEALLDRREKYDGSWEASLRHQLNTLPNFDNVFEDVVKYLKILHHNFNA